MQCFVYVYVYADRCHTHCLADLSAPMTSQGNLHHSLYTVR